ncbi:CHAT domain-containing protein [Candidatus Viridilinea mediisalina]|uniref:CHAT domain-containing protein n=1 Tax=Candidatus Viridilinea mediisalina TaxID=2024553 RepID=A0A2A6RKG2_9CHLR|nr:CHAT domain-containing protein [Candidatus Viridilinea mediisalina]PDW03512.1 hypothetical protein CJ255_08500 [Candidatus Viridilinea mediisalina]
MLSTPDPIALELNFIPQGEGAIIRWEAAVLGVRLSRLGAPIPPEDVALVLRALDMLQDPDYPLARTAHQERQFTLSSDERARLADLKLISSHGHVVNDAPRRLGRRLFAALTEDVAGRVALDAVRDHALATGAPLHITLGFPPEAARLAALPWELLWDAGPAPLLLGRGMQGSLTRRLDLAQALPPPRRGSGPLRILAISPMAGIGPELRQVERAARQEALAPLLHKGLALVHELEPANREALADAVSLHGPFDIIHFYGHGRLRGPEGELLLDTPRGGDWFSAGAMASLVGGVGLVALFACQGASINVGAGEALLGGVAQTLVAAGAPAVLGMQLAVRASAAARAAACIYHALATGESLQHGVALARRALFVSERDTTSWFVPTLYLRERSGGPYCLRPTLPPSTPNAAAQAQRSQQSVIARGGTIRALRIQGQPGSTQRVYASAGGRIADVVMKQGVN